MIRKARKLFYVMVIMKKNVQRALGAAFLLFITVIGIYSGNVEWKCRYQCDFSSRILFPPPYAGQPFYTSKGSVRDDIEL